MGFQLITAPAGGAPVLGYGDEFPTVSVPQGMLFVRTDQSRLYIRESGAWKEMLDVDPSGDVTLTGDLIMGTTTLTEAEMGVLDAVVAGTRTVSKANVPDANLEFAGLGEVRVADKLITSAEVLALFATPIEVVAAPGAGITLEFVGAYVLLDFNTTVYVAGAGKDLVFKYTNAAGISVSQAIDDTALNDGADRVLVVHPRDTDPVFANPAHVNTPIVAHILVGELTTGDSPFKVRVFYRHIRTASLEAIS